MFFKIKKILFGSKKKITVTCLIVLVIVVVLFLTLGKQSSTPQYQTAQVQKGTLVVSLAEAGQVSVSNKVSVVTQASGIVSNIYVKSGDTVKQGDKIADVTLDTAGQQRQAQAWANYLSAQSALNSAQAQLNSLQAAMFVANQKFVTDRGVINPSSTQQEDPVYIEEDADWLQAEANYENQTGVITQAQANVNNAYLTYQLTSGTITAPTAGKVSDLVITKGMQVGSSNTTSGSSTTTSNQAIASIQTGDSTTVTVSIAEVDAAQIQVGQQVTITFDAIPNETFTGKVMGIDTTGVTSSGVVTYPAVIQLDDTNNGNILPNMSATANIITKIKNDVLLVPSTAVHTQGAVSTVNVLENGQPVAVTVQVGDSSDSQTEITSGLSEGETVITSSLLTTTTQSSGTTSPFSGALRIGGGSFGGGGAVRTGGGGAGAAR